MCGIVGYIGKKNQAVDFIISGLEALEYRGYDSAGLATFVEDKARYIKKSGRVQNIKSEVNNSSLGKSSIAIGHTRWATHGSPTTQNSHPHFNKDKTIFVVHNGIIENYQVIKDKLIKEGYLFVSNTDTEVIPHLIDFHLKNQKNFNNAFTLAIKELSGAYAIAAINTQTPDKIYVARLSSPLVVGVGKKEHFIASDPGPLLDSTKKVIYLDDYETAEISAKNIKIHNYKKSSQITRQAEELDFSIAESQLGDFKHYMQKEIFEAPQTIQSATRGRIKPELNEVKLGGLENVTEQLRYIDRIVIVACGTSYYAGLVGEYLIEEIAGIPVEVQLASEFKYRNEPFSRSTALLAISQSGETADTIAAIKKVSGYGVLKLGIVNAVGSTISRITDAGVYCHAGPELSVASTKAFIAQVTVLADIALYLSRGANSQFKAISKELQSMPDKVKLLLKSADEIQSKAQKYAKYRDFLFIGRGYSYPCALEGALKLKEISYIHAEGYSAGEMKHGPLAMIDKNFPTFAIAPSDSVLEKTLSNIEEIKARNGPVIAIATKGSRSVAKKADDTIYIPPTLEPLQPLLIAIVLQLFSYYVAVVKGLNVDRPRNLAKSVTVE